MSYFSEDHKYDYGKDRPNLRPGTRFHDWLREEILQRGRLAHSRISGRYDTWKRLDETLTSYIPLDEHEKKLKGKDSRKPVSIIFPYSYAVLETILSYLVAAFLQDPVFKYEGVSPEDTLGAIMLEKVIQQHCVKSRVGLNLHTLFRDSLVYGVGYGTPYWRVKEGFKYGRREVDRFDFESDDLTKTVEQIKEWGITFEGNALKNLDPYKVLPDPNAGLPNIEDSEFFGWVADTNKIALKKQERMNPEYIFNVKYLDDLGSSIPQSIFAGDSSGRDTKSGVSAQTHIYQRETHSLEVLSMYVDLIPADWEYDGTRLGNSEEPEKWIFEVAGGEIIIRANKLDLDHNEFPVVCASPDYDGHAQAPIGRLEVLQGLQGVLDFLINSHIKSVRQAVNNSYVVDPYTINMATLQAAIEKGGGLIHLNKPSFGKPIGDSIHQLGINDVTRQHIPDANYITSAMMQVGGVDEATMGVLRKGGPERLTGREFQGTQQGMFTRIERIARIISLQAMQPLGEFFASHARQFMTQEMFMDVTGEWQEVLHKEYAYAIEQGKMQVSPMDLSINYDLKVRDGSIPGQSNYSSFWLQMLEMLASHPELQQTFDIKKIFAHIGRNEGAKNVENFIKTEVLPDEQVQKQAEAGNIIPIGQGIA